MLTTTRSATIRFSCSSRHLAGVLDRARHRTREHAARLRTGIPARRRGHRRCSCSARRGGVDVSEVQKFDWGSLVFFSDLDGNGWAVQQIPAGD